MKSLNFEEHFQILSLTITGMKFIILKKVLMAVKRNSKHF